MTRINFSDNIHARGRDLHLQTNTVEDEHMIVSRLFDGGRVLTREGIGYNPEWTQEELNRYAEVVHSELLVSIELLYGISSRVKTVRHPPSLNKLGSQFLKWNLLDEAISEFELAIQYDSYYGELYLNLGEAYLRRGGLTEAIRILEKGVQVSSGYADMWQKLGMAYLKKGQYKKAIHGFQQAIKINNVFDMAHFCFALCLIEVYANGKKSEDILGEVDCMKLAKEHLNKAVAVSKRFQTALVEEGLRRFHKREIGRALTIFWKVIDDLPRVVDLNLIDSFYLGFLYGDKGKDSEIVQKYVERLEILSKKHQKFPDIHNELGIAYMIQCKDLFNRALHQFRVASKINPKYKRALNNLKLAENEGKGLLILLRALLK